MSQPPEDEDEARERLAESLVDEALSDYRDLVPPDAFEEIRSYLVDELLCTSYGLARLRRLSALPTVTASDEILVGHEQLLESKKKKDSG